jgi:diphosphomevalonate decarboxylase
MILTATAVAHPNIALAKYWGKAPGLGNAPAVPSLSVTLAGMETTTTVRFDEAADFDSLTLDGGAASEAETARATELLDRVREKAGFSLRASVVSHNNFPTASGLASSASGFAALAVAAMSAAGLPEDPSLASDWARRASASSARSLFGGFVELDAGDGTDGFLPARQVAPAHALPLRVIVAVTTHARKAVASRKGMNHTAATSPYYGAWLLHAPTVFAEVRQAISSGDFVRLGEACEDSALAMHASAIAARPGIIYWNGASLEAFAAVQTLRAQGIPAYATMDAGPHVKVLCHPRHEETVVAALRAVPGVHDVLVTQPGEGARIIPSGPGQPPG